MKKQVLGIGLIALMGMQACNSGLAKEEGQNSSSEEAPQETQVEAENGVSLEPLWETEMWYPTNESVLLDESQGLLYVSCIAGNPTDKDGKGHIARLNLDGTIIDSAWAQGYNAPKGMCISNGRLYFTDIDRIVSVSLANPKDELIFPVPGSTFLNDITPGLNGVYFSDMNTGKLQYLEQGVVHTLNEDLTGINGLSFFENELYALTGQGLLRLSLGGEVLETINSELTGGDGLVPLGSNRFIASRWQGEVWYLNGGQSTKLVDSKAEELQTADIGYNAADQVLYVPRFFGNKVTAFRLKGLH
tara:strand:+ start:9853 stop:10761 length:909 start_codon:yes stop_codon:yes gene_type:complete